jgi:hypothetical protein
VTTATDHSLHAHAQAGAIGDTTDPDPAVRQRARGPRRDSAQDKAQVLEGYEGLDKASKGARRRREGLASVPTRYRLLRAHDEVGERRRQATTRRPPNRRQAAHHLRAADHPCRQ